MEENKLIFYRIHGLNFNKFLKTLQKNNIEVFNLTKLEDNNFCLEIRLKDEKVFNNNLLACNMNVITKKPKSKDLKIFLFLKKNLIYVVCAFVLFLSIIISNFFVFKIEIYGLKTIQKSSVEQVLNKNNFNVFKLKSSYNLSSIQAIIKTNFENVSLASCTIVGNTLVVNILEKFDTTSNNTSPIIAPFNMIISSINLKSGTSLVAPNQMVQEGSELVSNYITYKDGSKLEVEANAEISGYAEKSVSTLYYENHYKFIRTGKKEIFSDLKFLKPKNKLTCSFNNYETEKSEEFVFKNFFIPIKREKIIFYELSKKLVFEPFNENIKQKLIVENENLLYNAFNSCKNVENKKFSSVVEKVENYYIVSTTISANIVI